MFSERIRSIARTGSASRSSQSSRSVPASPAFASRSCSDGSTSGGAPAFKATSLLDGSAAWLSQNYSRAGAAGAAGEADTDDAPPATEEQGSDEDLFGVLLLVSGCCRQTPDPVSRQLSGGTMLGMAMRHTDSSQISTPFVRSSTNGSLSVRCAPFSLISSADGARLHLRAPDSLCPHARYASNAATAYQHCCSAFNAA